MKLAGSRSYVVRGAGSRLYHAVLRYAMDVITQRNYEPFVVPVLVTEQCMIGTGYFPAGKDQAYITQDNTVLVGTSEVPERYAGLPTPVLLDIGRIGGPWYTAHWAIAYDISDGLVHLGNCWWNPVLDERTFLEAWHCHFLPYGFNHCGVYAY